RLPGATTLAALGEGSASDHLLTFGTTPQSRGSGTRTSPIPSPVPLPSRFPVICGPTAGGKTAAAVALAHLVHEKHGITTEIVTADAYQIYKGMDIGTAKPTLAEREGIPHHLIDLVDPTERFTLDQWLSAAEAKIAELRARNVLPIVVG